MIHQRCGGRNEGPDQGHPLFTKGVTGALNGRQRIPPIYTGGGAGKSPADVAGAVKDQARGQGRPPFYMWWWFVK